jgi:membrane protease YdiL (CAAX protease family)
MTKMGGTFTDEPAAPAALGLWRFWPLRFVLFFVVLIGAYIGCQLLPKLIGPHVTFLPAYIPAIVLALLSLAVLITVYRLLVQWTEKRAASELSAHRALASFAGGAAIGIALFCAVIAVLAVYGGAHIGGVTGYDGLVKAAAASLVAAVGEEIAFRGSVYRLLEEGFGTLIAIAISGAMFGLLHAGNHGATTASTLAIALEAGILLAAAYVLTRSLWLPIGLHFGWNFTEGGIFGAAVSGGKSHGLIATSFSGPDWLTGGAFGPEASVPAVILCVIAAMILLAFALRRGEWKPMRLRLATG